MAMFFIMWLHAGTAPGWLGRPVGGGICLFFLMAGYFMPRDARACAVRALRLGLAWLLWSLITFGLYLAVWDSLQWSWARVFGWQQAAYNAPLWFLRNLALYQLLIAGAAALKWLPRHSVLITVMFAGFTFAAEPRQHEALRFDWMTAVLLGYCLRAFSLEAIRAWLCRHAAVLTCCVAVLLLQRELYPLWLKYLGIGGYRCSLPIASLGYAVLFCLAAIGVESRLPRVARCTATAGTCMIFIYAAHSLLYAPIYYWDIHGWYDVWAPLAALPILTVAARALRRHFPRVMRLLCTR